MTYSIIKKSQLEGALRLDADYYQPKFLNLFSKIQQHKNSKLYELAKIIRGNTPKKYDDDGISIIRSGDLSYQFIKENLLKTQDNNVFYVRNKDILISSIGLGSIGKVNIFTQHDEKTGTVSEVTILRGSKINPFYLWAFLSSKFGQFKIDREITGATGQLHLNTGNVENIVIPIFKEDKVFENFYCEAENSYKASQKFYQLAENLLLEQLHLDDFKNKNILCSVMNLSEIKKANRIDAEYYCGEYPKLLANLNKIKNKTISEILLYNKRGIQPVYDNGSKFYALTSQYIKDEYIDYESLPRITETNFNKGISSQLKLNDIVIYTTGAYVGQTQTWLDNEKL